MNSGMPLPVDVVVSVGVVEGQQAWGAPAGPGILGGISGLWTRTPRRLSLSGLQGWYWRLCWGEVHSLTRPISTSS